MKMTKASYYKSIVSLFEDVSTQNVMSPAEDKFNPDAGFNVNDDVKEAEMDPEEIEEEEESLPIQEGPMPEMESYGIQQEPEFEPTEVKRKGKMFKLFKQLLTYSSVFHETLNTIIIDSIESEDVRQIQIMTKQIDEIVTKIEDYLLKNFEEDGYEKVLYIYILLRTELLTVIKLLRQTLGLDSDLTDENLK